MPHGVALGKCQCHTQGHGREENNGQALLLLFLWEEMKEAR